MIRIGLLTSGGDCQALNATMRGVVKGLAANVDRLEVYGFMNGYKGLIYGDYRLLTAQDFSGILTRGGTIIGTSRQPFKLMREPDKNGLDKVEAMKQNYYKLRLDCLVILGGNGTQKTANLLREEGLNILHLPKTIDNDIWGTEIVNISPHILQLPHFFPYLLIFRIGFFLGLQHFGIFFPQSLYGRQFLHTQAVKIFLCRLMDQNVSFMLGPELFAVTGFSILNVDSSRLRVVDDLFLQFSILR